MVHEIRQVAERRRVGYPGAGEILFHLGAALCRKFPHGEAVNTDIEEVRRWVAARDRVMVIAQLMGGKIPLCLYPLLPPRLQNLLDQEEAERLYAQAPPHPEESVPLQDSLLTETRCLNCSYEYAYPDEVCPNCN